MPTASNRPVFLLALGQTLAWSGLFYLFPALLLRFEQDLGWSKTELTGAITLAILVSAMASPLAGRIIDTGRGPLLMAGSAIFGGLCLAALYTISDLWQFYIIWGLIGIAMAGCLYEPCFALVTRARGRHAKRGIIIITLIAGFASTISFPAAHTFSELYGWRVTAVIFSAIVIFLAAPILWVGAYELERSGAAQARTSKSVEGRRKFLKRPAFWFLAFGFAFIALAHGATLHHLLPLLDEYKLSTELAVLAASFIGPMQVAGRLAMTASEKFTSHHGLTVSAFISLAFALALLAFSQHSPFFLSTFVIFFGGAYGMVSILRPLIAREVLGGNDFGVKSGALAVPYLMGAAIAPYFGSLLWHGGGYFLMLCVLIGLLIIGCTSYIVAQKTAARA